MENEVLKGFPHASLSSLLSLSIREDIGPGDITTEATIPKNENSTARLLARQSGIICGLPVVMAISEHLKYSLECREHVSEGQFITAGEILATLKGPTREILAAERILLNFIQHLSGVATKSAGFAKLVAHTKTRILDTRKTTPGYRQLEKYAVRMGGCENHREGLFDRVLIKDNHIQACGSPRKAVTRALEKYGDQYTVECEVDTLSQLQNLSGTGIHWVMLDNMSVPQMKECLDWAQTNMPGVIFEASGNMTKEKIKASARLGLDYISVGALTHSVEAFDLSLEFTESRVE